MVVVGLLGALAGWLPGGVGASAGRLRIGGEVLVMKTDELRGAIDDLRLGAD